MCVAGSGFISSTARLKDVLFASPGHIANGTELMKDIYYIAMHDWWHRCYSVKQPEDESCFGRLLHIKTCIIPVRCAARPVALLRLVPEKNI